MCILCSAAWAEDDYVLDFGFHSSWAAKVLFNPQGGTVSAYHQWEPLYESRSTDTITITLPGGTDIYNEICFRTPVSLTSGRQYSFALSLLSAEDISGVQIQLRETGGRGSTVLSRTRSLTAGTPLRFSSGRFTAGSDIQNLELAIIVSGHPDAQIGLTGVTLIDVSDNKEIYDHTQYFTYTYSNDLNASAEVSGATLTGRYESKAWTQADYDDGQWDAAAMPIGNSGFSVPVQTVWQGSTYNNYWIRRTFTLDEVSSSTEYELRVCHDDSYAVYVNGHLMDEASDWTTGSNYVSITVPTSYLHEGTNVIATYIQQNYGGCFYDCALLKTDNAYASTSVLARLKVNEIQVANIDQYLDYSYNYGGWLEFYNPTSEAIPLAGLYVSDDSTNLMKAAICSDYDAVPAHGFRNIWFDNNNKKGQFGPYAYKQVDLKLDDEGGTLYFTSPGGDRLFSFTYPAAIARCSWAATTDGGTTWQFTGDPTPQSANAASTFASQRLDAPLPSVDSRLFSSDFTVRVPIPTGVTLMYTTDGSTPTLQNGQRSVLGRFTISQTTVLRLRFFRTGYLPSRVVTRSYILRDQDYYLPVVSIVSAPDNLYGDSIGVYVDGVNGVSGRNYGKSNINMDWERPVNFEYITPADSMGANLEAEFTVSGGWSRHYAPASFKIKASNLYENQNSIDYPFFPLKPYNRYKEILIRNGGNDNGSSQYGRVRDGITQQVLLSSGFRVDAQDFQPIHLFINGKYIGMMNLREPSNRYNGTANYGFDKDSIDAFEYSNGYYQKAGDNRAFREWVTLSAGAKDSAVYEALRQRVDMDEVINYFAAISYIGSSDWILNSNNVKGYRPREDGGRFHLVLFDQDWGWSSSSGVRNLGNSSANDLVNIYNNMRKNTKFQRQFVNAFCLLAGSVYTQERGEAIGDSICRLVEPALEMEGRTPWTSYNTIKSAMTQGQSARISALRTAYSLGTGMKVSLSANIPQAQLMLDQQPVPTNKFNGTLFAPVTITATAPAGYVFEGWQSRHSQTVALFAAGSRWNYYDGGSLDAISDWNTAGYSASWPSGHAPFGYDTGNNKSFSTTLSYGSSASNKRPTYYFRKSVSLDKATLEGAAQFLFNYIADDGFVLYVNGVEAYRYLMPDGAVSYSTFSTDYARSNPDQGTFSIPASYFREGENLIAVELHNCSASSSDIYWDGALSYSTQDAPVVSASNKLVLSQDVDGDYVALFRPIEDELARYDAGGTPLRVNEVSAANDVYQSEYFKKNDWIELYNTTDEDIDLAGMYVSDNALRPTKYQIPATEGVNTVVPAHGTIVLWADRRPSLTQIHLPFRLDNADGSVVSLQSEDGYWRDVLTYNSHSKRESYGRYPNGGNTLYNMYVPTINRSNQLSSYDFDAALLGVDDNSYIQTSIAVWKGWNWLSHNLRATFPASRFTNEADALRSNDAALQKGDDGQWQGSLVSVLPATGYKLHALSAHDIVLTGNYFDLNQSVGVKAGWNWVGCPLPNATNLSAALQNYSPSEGDRLVGQAGFSVYNDGEWEGTLTALEPGNAYMLYANKSQQFQWNAVAAPQKGSRRYSTARNPQEEKDYPAVGDNNPASDFADSGANSWTADIHAYPDVMNVIATLKIDEEDADVSQYTVGAFADGECRGVAEVVDNRLYLNICGDSAKALTFKVMDAQGQVMDAEQQTVFSPLMMLGTKASPYVLSALTVGVHSVVAGQGRILRVEYFNAQGLRVSPQSRGFLIQRTTYQDGHTCVKKIIR